MAKDKKTLNAFIDCGESIQVDCTHVYPSATLSHMKDAGLRIRVQRELRKSFLEACQAQDKPAAQVLREFMREYVRLHPPQQGEIENKKEGQNGN